MGPGENAGTVNHIVDAGLNTRRHAVPMLHRYDRFDKALALSQQLDQLFIDNIDLVAQFRDTGLFCC